MRGYSASDTGDYGIVRFVVDDPDKALGVLRDELRCAPRKRRCCACAGTSPASWRVMGVLVRDATSTSNTAIRFISTYICLYVKDLERAERLLAEQPVELLAQRGFEL